MIRALLCLLSVLSVVSAQTPEEYFRGAGAGFRGTAEEQRLFWQPHIENSHQWILTAADLAAGHSIATVLGPGVCFEIPLEELAQRFDRVILIDMDGPSMLEALERVPMELRGKIELRVADVTTFATDLMERFEAAVDESDTVEEALERYGTIIDELSAGRQRLYLPTSDLVVSSLVLSELHRYPLAYADRLMRTRFKTRLDTWGRYAEARRRVRQLAIEDHIAILARLCRADGAIYFGDTVTRGPAHGRFDAALTREVNQSVLLKFRRLGLAETVDEVGPAIARLCHGEAGIEAEIAAFEVLLSAYARSVGGAFEVLVPLEELRRQWEEQELHMRGAINPWWWLEYPCAIVHSPGAFRVRSWILVK